MVLLRKYFLATHFAMNHYPHILHSRAGKVTLFTALVGSALAIVIGLVGYLQGVPEAIADNVSTSVTVLNTAPNWTVDAEESTESSATTPTNAGTTISWIGTATDDNAENYFLIICKTSASSTANPNAPPSCAGGLSNQWAISATTTSGAVATASTSTTEYAPFQNESNDWYAWICDANGSLPKCNFSYTQGSGSTASPFIINHPPIFGNIATSSAIVPGGTVTWTSTSFDNDSVGGQDQVQLFVCKAADFVAGTSAHCGAGGAWATSTLFTTNAATSSTTTPPQQDKNYDAYVYLVDSHGLAATSTFQAFNAYFTINNVAPTVTAGTIALLDADEAGPIQLVTANSTSGPFKVKFTVVDDNSCLTAASGDEVVSAVTNVYRSGVGSTSCYLSGHFNTNSCYTSASPLFTGLTCTQDAGQCSGASDSDTTWTCTFPLWFNADPTDASTQYTAQNWLATVEVTDDDTATSSLIEDTDGNEMGSFMAFDVTETSIGYGGLEPGQNSGTLSTTTALIAYGNVGLDQDIYGDTMCTDWTSPDSCDAGGVDTTREIPITNQKAATSSVLYGSSFAYAISGSTTPTEVLINVLKTTSTSSAQQKSTYWGINIPSAITLAGDYTGQNTITAKKSNPSFW